MNKPLKDLLRASYAKAGKRLDFGKACARFKTVGDRARPATPVVVEAVPVKASIGFDRAGRAKPATGR